MNGSGDGLVPACVARIGTLRRNGLCVIEVQADGQFKRVWTPAADAYKIVIERDLKQKR